MAKTKTTSYTLSDWLNYLSHDEIDFIKDIANKPKINNPVIVNIGAGAGTSGLAFAEARPGADLYTVDISPGGPKGGLEGERHAFDGANLVYPTQILGDSKIVGKDWKLNIDILFVDGDHSASGIRGDIEAWVPHVKKGGYVIFHDYEQSKWPEVKKAVDELMSEYEDIGTVGRIKAFVK